MDLPLRLEVRHLTPCGLLSSAASDDPVPPVATPLPPLPSDLHFSPTSNYPGPHGTALLGETIRGGVTLRNITHSEDVRGAKMMLEVQSPTSRTRLGEAVHGGREEGTEPAAAEERPWDQLPALRPGEGVDIDVEHDVVELGSHILIVSVAWETQEGRRTFQRFLKFSVTAPLAIKTRVHLPTNPNTALDAQRRSAVYLEVLMQNVSPSSMVFEGITLRPMEGLSARSLGSGSAEDADADAASTLPTPSPSPAASPSSDTNTNTSLLPGDTTQRLFVLTPTLEEEEGHPESVFPPSYPAGTVLSLGRLDIAWVSGIYREPGYFTTSTLNRRTPALVAPPSRPTSLIGNAAARLSLNLSRWEFDLTVSGSRSALTETELPLTLRVAVRSPPTNPSSVSATQPPPPLRIGVQLVSPTEAPSAPVPPAPPVAVSILPPSRTGTPRPASTPRPSSPASGRPFSPLSRPMTPVSAQLRHAVTANIASPSPSPAPPPPPAPAPVSFPPAPVFEKPPQPLSKRLAGATHTPAAGSNSHLPVPVGAAQRLGPSLVVPEPKGWQLVQEQDGDHKRWETVYDVPVSWIAVEEGLVELGGARVLLMDSESVGKEWESLGEVWVEAQ